MNKRPDKKTIEEIAIELGVDAAFIEKDWHAIKALQIIEQVRDGDFCPVFSGGTSLSKGYGLIERFSEDLDFKIIHPDNATRSTLRNFREGMYAAFDGHRDQFKIIEESKISRDGSRFFGCAIEYDRQFTPPSSIRPHVKLEFSFRAPYLGTERRKISSFATQFSKEKPDLEMACIRPVETSADKLNALIWRVKGRDRRAEGDDPAMIRHLHDLARLEGTILGEKAEFWGLAKEIYITDKVRSGTEMPDTLIEAMEELVTGLRGDKLYETEYVRFVTGVSYADEQKQLGYAAALKALGNIKASCIP